MKKIEAIIQPYKLADVKEALEKVGVQGMTVIEAQGFGQQKGHSDFYRGSEYVVAFVPKLKLEIMTTDAKVSQTIEAVMRAARTGRIGDGKILVLPIEDALRIRTGEHGDAVA